MIWPNLLAFAVSAARMSPYLPPWISAVCVEFGKETTASPARKATHLGLAREILAEPIHIMEQKRGEAGGDKEIPTGLQARYAGPRQTPPELARSLSHPSPPAEQK